jgi:hypothetical protein
MSGYEPKEVGRLSVLRARYRIMDRVYLKQAVALRAFAI